MRYLCQKPLQHASDGKMRSIRSWWHSISAGLRLNPRSNGVRVRRTTAIYIKAGNLARAQQKWSSAADAYRRALTSEPHLQHLWVQLGHMEKEAGHIDLAASAYQEAARLRPEDAEPLLQLGHMTKAWHQPADAAGYFVAALQRDPTDLQAISELVRLMPDRDEVDPNLWSAVLDVLEIDPAEQQSDDVAPLSPGAIVFDVTDLLAYFGQRRLPTGIQRVQIEVSLACFDDRFDPRPIFVVYSSTRRGWVKLSSDRFAALCKAARNSDDVKDPIWISQLDQMYRKIAVARTIRFLPGTVLVNLGTSWSDRNYLLDVRTVRARDALVYVPLVFDLIPLIGPHWFVQSLVRDYRAWFGSMLHSADGCLAISEATREDLLRTSAEWKAPMPRESVPFVHLNGNFRQAAADAGILRAYGLEPQRYVLFVSTLEPRKNHQGAFEAWLELADSLGEEAVPRLVCVGGRGWLNEHLHQMLRERPLLRRLVLILHGIPDDVLAALYEHCLFSLYPSLYEGWGLPVSESLSYGKVPAISRISSLPEAGGSFARYFDPNMSSNIAATVCTLLDEGTRLEAEAAIHQNYKSRTWYEAAHELVAKANEIPSRVQDTLPCLAYPGSWTLALSHQNEEVDQEPAARKGEALRHGVGWAPPGMTGCGINGDDAALWFRWAGGCGSVLHLHFVQSPSGVKVSVGDGDGLREYRAEPGVALVVSTPLPDTATTLHIPIVPIAGDVAVEKIVITRTSLA